MANGSNCGGGDNDFSATMAELLSAQAEVARLEDEVSDHRVLLEQLGRELLQARRQATQVGVAPEELKLAAARAAEAKARAEQEAEAAAEAAARAVLGESGSLRLSGNQRNAVKYAVGRHRHRFLGGGSGHKRPRNMKVSINGKWVSVSVSH